MIILSIRAKCDDRFYAELSDEKEIFAAGSGNVPSFMPGDHKRDYVVLDIDIETGRIINWKPTSKDEMIEQLDKMDL